jgi:hypothetical protein
MTRRKPPTVDPEKITISSRGPRAAEAFKLHPDSCSWHTLLHVDTDQEHIARVLIDATSPDTLKAIGDALVTAIRQHLTENKP